MLQVLRRSSATIYVFFLVSMILMAGAQGGACLTLDPVVQEALCDCEGVEGLTGNQAREGGAPVASSTGPPLQFEWNLGQAAAPYQFVSRTARGYSIYLAGGEAVVESPGAMVRARLAGARAGSTPEPEHRLPGRVNYLRGPDPSRWITDVPVFERVRYREVYPGIDVVYYGNGTLVEHDFTAASGADPGLIRFLFEGADRVMPNADGDLVVTVGKGEFRWKKPVIFQSGPGGKRRLVQGRYRQAGDGSVGFEIGAYDPARELIIDPEIQIASYLGGRNNDLGGRVAVDASGNIYIAGSTNDSLFPVTPGAFRTPPGPPDGNDVVISKFRPDGTGLVFSTYIGGQQSDLPSAIATDSEGNVYFAGATRSADYPTTAGALQRQPGSNVLNARNRSDCFVTKLNSAGNALVYSTLLGGRDIDACTYLVVDAGGNAYVTGTTSSSNFPTTEGTLQPLIRAGFGEFDAFAAKINPAGSALLYGTFFGGSGNDVASGIAIDAAGNAYIAGTTNSNANFPVTPGAFQMRYNQEGAIFDRSKWDSFVVKLNAAGTGLVYGTYLGGGRTDTALGIAVDSQGSAYVCGNTLSADFPVTDGAYQRTNRGSGGQFLAAFAAGDGFAAKLNPAGTSLVYSTFLGGTHDDRAIACALDSTGSLHLAGHTMSADFPVTNDAQQRAYAGKSATNLLSAGDAFYTRLDAQGRALLYSTYHGGNDEDGAGGIALDRAGSAFLAGSTASSNLPVTPNAAQRLYGGGLDIARAFFFGDAFIVKYSDIRAAQPAIASAVSAASGAGGAVAAGEILNIFGTNLGPAAALTAQPGGGVYPKQLGQVRVLFDQTEAALLAVGGSQIGAVAPFGIADKSSVQLVVDYQGNRSAPVTIPVAAARPGIFTVNGSGRGQAVGLNEDGSPNPAGNRAAPGSVFTLILTGGGATDPVAPDGSVPAEDHPPLAAPAAVTVGEAAADEVFYSGGMAGRVAGTVKVVFRLPAELPSGDVPVVVRIGDAASQTGVTIAIAESP